MKRRGKSVGYLVGALGLMVSALCSEIGWIGTINPEQAKTGRCEGGWMLPKDTSGYYMRDYDHWLDAGGRTLQEIRFGKAYWYKERTWTTDDPKTEYDFGVWKEATMEVRGKFGIGGVWSSAGINGKHTEHKAKICVDIEGGVSVGERK